MGLTPGLGRALGGGNGNPLHCSCVENPMGRGAWWAIVHGVTKSQTRMKQISPPILFVVYVYKCFSLRFLIFIV